MEKMMTPTMTIMMPKINTMVDKAAFVLRTANTPMSMSKMDDIKVLSVDDFNFDKVRKIPFKPLMTQATPTKNKTYLGLMKAYTPTSKTTKLTKVEILLLTKIEKVKDEKPIIKNINVMIRTAKIPIKLGKATKKSPRTEMISPSVCK